MPVRAVLDTNVVARGLLHPTGAPRELIDAWLAGRFTQVTCICLADELRHILNHPPLEARLQLTPRQVNQLLAAFLSESKVVSGRVQLNVLERFPREDCLLSCAVEGAADYLVTTEPTLLTLGEYGGFTIADPERFVTVLAATD